MKQKIKCIYPLIKNVFSRYFIRSHSQIKMMYRNVELVQNENRNRLNKGKNKS